jgi:dTDP-4-amino-4,6-dideoxygalactose transaminase
LAHRLKRLRVHGDVGQYEHLEIGMNSRLDALQATVLRIKLRKLEQWTVARQQNARRYAEQFRANGLNEFLAAPKTLPERRHVFNQYCVRVRHGGRDAVMQQLRNRKVGCAVYYPKPLHLQTCFAELGYRPGDFPQAEAATREILALPIYPELPSADHDRVVEELTRACHGLADAARPKRKAA